jgi:hypothetical protein
MKCLSITLIIKRNFAFLNLQFRDLDCMSLVYIYQKILAVSEFEKSLNHIVWFIGQVGNHPNSGMMMSQSFDHIVL